MRKQIETLEHKTDATAQTIDVGVGAIHVMTVEQNLALLHVFKTVDGADQCRFTRAGWPAQHHHFAALHLGGDVGQGLVFAIPFVDPGKHDHWMHGATLTYR